MKKLILIILFVSISSSVIASEMGTLTNRLVLCETRDAAFPNMIVATLADAQGTDIEVINSAAKKSGCIFCTKPFRVKVYKMTKEIIKGNLIHYAQVSLISAGDIILDKETQDIIMWIAAPFDPKKKGVNMIKLDSGKYW